MLTEPAPGRFAFHDLLAAYAAELARAREPAADRHGAIARLLDHYLHTAHAADRLLHPHRDPIPLPPAGSGVAPEEPTDSNRALAWFTAERAVLLAAVRLAGSAGFDGHTYRLAWTLAVFLDWQGRWTEWAASQEAAAAAAKRAGDRQMQGYALRSLGGALVRMNRVADGYASFRRALDLYEASGDHAGQAFTHHNLASIAQHQQRPDDAVEHAQRALDLFGTAGHVAGEANARNAVGWYLAQAGDFRGALIHCREALRLHAELGNRSGRANARDSLGFAHHHLGEYPEAVVCYERAGALYRDLGDRYDEAYSLARIGDTHHAAGRPDAARAVWRRALSILDELDHPEAADVRAKLSDT
jgi:tetratricopeptide (TPR) repeat protein